MNGMVPQNGKPKYSSQSFFICNIYLVNLQPSFLFRKKKRSHIFHKAHHLNVSCVVLLAGIPYSEHSSFLEMKRFVQWLKPHKIIPTVNVGDWKARNEMEKHFRDWKMGVAGQNQVEEWNLHYSICMPEVTLEIFSLEMDIPQHTIDMTLLLRSTFLFTSRRAIMTPM